MRRNKFVIDTGVLLRVLRAYSAQIGKKPKNDKCFIRIMKILKICHEIWLSPSILKETRYKSGKFITIKFKNLYSSFEENILKECGKKIRKIKKSKEDKTYKDYEKELKNLKNSKWKGKNCYRNTFDKEDIKLIVCAIACGSNIIITKDGFLYECVRELPLKNPKMKIKFLNVEDPDFEKYLKLTTN